METNNKPRVITDYEKLSEEFKEQIKLIYPYGYTKFLIPFFNREGKRINGLRFETDEKIYLIRMTVAQAEHIIDQDDDYDDDGNLLDSVKDDYEDKYSDLEYIPDTSEDED